MIIATAGHVDHGKTTLVSALTGEDTDRLAEEKRRGLSIDLGFAWHRTECGSLLGFVDVPGHERFIRNMVAGVAAVDFALLVVAADDGPMPQTLEHLAILDLLGVCRGVVAVTRVDRVPPERRDAVIHEVRRMLAPTGLAGASILPVSGLSGEGIGRLEQVLAQAAAAVPAASAGGHFRFAVDRCFSVRGSGCVVTGTVLSGALGAEEWLQVAPSGTRVRVRGIQVHGEPAGRVTAGQRCALNLAGGVATDDITRGDWLIAAALQPVSDRLDVWLRLLPDRTLSRGTVQVHLGAAVRSGRIVTPAGQDNGGDGGVAQLVLESPVHAVWHDRFIVRDPAGNQTLGGGVVLDPEGWRRGRASAPRQRVLQRLAAVPTPAEALDLLLSADATGLNLSRFARSFNLLPVELDRLAVAKNLQTVHTRDGVLGLLPDQVEELHQRLLERLRQWHVQHPDSLGLTAPELGRVPGMRLAPELMHWLCGRLLATGAMARTGFCFHEPGHEPRLEPQDQLLLARIREQLEPAGLRPPIVGDLALDLDLEKPQLLVFLERLHHLGLLVRVAPNRYFLPGTVSELARIAVALAGESDQGMFDARQYRDRSGIGRNLTIQVLEYLDRVGVTAFINEQRRIQPGYGASTAR